jgi:hypothetical protein
LRTEVVEIGYKSSRKKEKRKSGWHLRDEHTVKLFSESSQYFDCDLKMLGKPNFENRRHSYYVALTIGACTLSCCFVDASPVYKKFYATETHIMYFIQRC